MSNAIKFTREGSIAVRAMLEDDSDDELVQLRISVQDTGIGLSDADLRALFQAFTQADNSLSRQAGGTGLGLVISKRLIEQMGGEIGVSSTPGVGSEFWISLSLPKALDEIEDALLPSLHGRRVAMLEPQELTRQALCHQLEDCGLEVLDFPSLDKLVDDVAARRLGSRQIGLAVIGADVQALSPEQLSQRVWDLEQLGCKSLVLCPTTEQALYHRALPENHSQLQAKPACTRKLQQALAGLLSPRQPRIETQPQSNSRAPKLLCVDDNPANLLLVQTLLSDMGAEVRAVDSGFAAVEAVQRERFDLVLMDVQMPGMDGTQATETIRRWESEQRIDPVPIVALTAHALANEKRALLQGGMDDYLTKPIGERQLTQVVLKWSGLSLGGQPTTQRLGREEREEREENGLEVLDPEEGLRLAAGKADLASDMLSMLLASLDADREAIQQAAQNGDRSALLERVHRLHGATRYCGVPQLRAACQRSETLLKQNDPAAEHALKELDAAITRLAEAARIEA
ncbi:Signal transduction histidine-protein kinase BarA [compost metagenome]